jgi:hypothetical protein
MSTVTSTTQTQLPAFYTQFSQNLLGKATTLADEDYKKYEAPRVAPFNADQLRGMEIARQNVGISQPYLTQANEIAGRAATASFPDSAQSYMNPYIQGVVNNIGTMAARNLQESLLPQVNRTFVGGGTFGGSRSADFTARAVRDANESAMRQQAETLASGYGQAADIFNNDTTRQLSGARQIAGIGEQMREAGAADVRSVMDIGQQQQNLAQTSANMAYEDFSRQRDDPQNKLKFLSDIGRGISIPNTTVSNTPGANRTAQDIGAVTAGIGTFLDALKKAGVNI